MMLPILISVSDAPVSYFFCANAAPVEAKAIAPAASAATTSFCPAIIVFSLLAFLEAAEQMLGDECDLPGAMRHQEDDEKQNDAEHGAGKALGDALGDVRNEDDKGGADDRAGKPADTADDHAEEQRDGERSEE